jgi:ribosome maturation factor RimP
MREDSRRNAPRTARAPGRSGQGRDTRAPRGPVGRSDVGASGQRGGGRPQAPSAAATPRLTSLIESVLTAMEIDLEAVKVISAGRRVVLRIVVDADGGISLDDIAEVSREISAKLDAKDAMGDAPYTLEVTSPGIDRPLTQSRHWRRATGRLVAVPLMGKDQDFKRDAAGPAEYLGRVIDVDQDRVTFETDGARRTFSLAELGPGRVQAEFGRLDEIGADEIGTDEIGTDEIGTDEIDEAEIDEADPRVGPDAGSDSGGSPPERADKEGHDGH